MAQQQNIFEKYVTHIEAYCGWLKVDGQNPDEEFMRAIETQIGVPELAKKAFREEILIRKSAFERNGKIFDHSSHGRLRNAIEKYIETTESA